VTKKEKKKDKGNNKITLSMSVPYKQKGQNWIRFCYVCHFWILFCKLLNEWFNIPPFCVQRSWATFCVNISRPHNEGTKAASFNKLMKTVRKHYNENIFCCITSTVHYNIQVLHTGHSGHHCPLSKIMLPNRHVLRNVLIIITTLFLYLSTTRLQ
jgi:hypothetical protein